MGYVLVEESPGVGSQNLEGDYLAEKANRYLFPSVRKVQHHRELWKQMVETHSADLGIQLQKGVWLEAWEVLTVRLTLLMSSRVTVQCSRKDHYRLTPERSN